MAVQLNYLAPRGWKPPRNNLITFLKIELSKKATKNFSGSKKKLFMDAAASVAAESSTGTWTKVYAGKNSGIKLANKYKALAFDLDHKNLMFKVAYPQELFEKDNISGILAGIVGNIAGMKMVSAMRLLDIQIPKKIIQAFPGPKFGIQGVRKLLKKPKGPLVVTVPKPKIGRTSKEQAILSKILFESGKGTYDGIKDDENLTDLNFNKFNDRCKLILNQIKKSENKTKNKKFYLCNITHSNLNKMLDRTKLIKNNSGIFLMLDVVTTGFSATDTIRRSNTGLAIHAHRAMHGFLTRDNSPGIHGSGNLSGFSISMIVLAKIFRLLGVDSLHGGSPLAKMEDYDEAEYIKHILQDKKTPPHPKIPSLGQEWHDLNSVWMTASGGLHPGDFEYVIDKLGEDIILQCGGGLLGHPEGVEAGVIAIEQARDLSISGTSIKEFVKQNPKSKLAKAVKYWGYGPKIVY